jgi:TPR repeat protein
MLSFFRLFGSFSLFFFGVALLFLAGPALAQNNKASASEPTNELDAHIKEVIAKVEQGDARAQAMLAQAYGLGHGVPLDYNKAFNLAEKSASAGDPEGQGFLSYLYSMGFGVDKDEKKAFKWMEKAAKQGSPKAQYALGVFYENGHGVKPDSDKAKQWFEKAAAQGYTAATPAPSKPKASEKSQKPKKSSAKRK